MILQIGQQLDKLETAKTNRFKPKFNDKENDELDSEIAVLRNTIYNNIKWCEMKLKQTREQMAVTGEIDSSHATIADNVQQAYLVKLKDAAKRLRQIEKDHIQKISKLASKSTCCYLPSVINQKAFDSPNFLVILGSKKMKRLKERD